jgi:hypothetical protein
MASSKSYTLFSNCMDLIFTIRNFLCPKLKTKLNSVAWVREPMSEECSLKYCHITYRRWPNVETIPSLQSSLFLCNKILFFSCTNDIQYQGRWTQPQTMYLRQHILIWKSNFPVYINHMLQIYNLHYLHIQKNELLTLNIKYKNHTTDH